MESMKNKEREWRSEEYEMGILLGWKRHGMNCEWLERTRNGGLDEGRI
jgi:hypothetical protein